MQPTLSEAPVNGLLHPKNGGVRISGPLKYLVNDQGNVLVKFGSEKQFRTLAEENACHEGEIFTPSSPSTPPSPSPPRKCHKTVT